MARIAGVDLPREKRLGITFIYIYGMGRTRAAETLAAMDISPDLRVEDAVGGDLVKSREYINSSFKIEGSLCRGAQANTRRKTEIGSYQGFHRRRSLPVHGQRIKTNTYTRRGPKRTVAGKRKTR